jgi:hypothetical protein
MELHEKFRIEKDFEHMFKVVVGKLLICPSMLDQQGFNNLCYSLEKFGYTLEWNTFDLLCQALINCRLYLEAQSDMLEKKKEALQRSIGYVSQKWGVAK